MRLRLNTNKDFEVEQTPYRDGPPTLAVEHNGPPPTNPSLENPTEADNASSIRASDRRPEVNPLRAQQLAAGDFDDLASLEAEAKQLESLARDLDSRAKAIERRVNELK